VIDPLERWREYGEKPDFAGLLTFGGLPYTEDPAELAGIDVAVVGAPTDDLVSDRPVFAHDVRRLGIENAIAQTIAIVGKRVAFLTIDVDVLDPPSRPGPARPSRAASPRRSCSGQRGRPPPGSTSSERMSSR
jgi:arginase family enzyme